SSHYLTPPFNAGSAEGIIQSDPDYSPRTHRANPARRRTGYYQSQRGADPAARGAAGGTAATGGCDLSIRRYGRRQDHVFHWHWPGMGHDPSVNQPNI